MNQKDTFLSKEGDNWFNRNKKSFIKSNDEIVLRTLVFNQIKPRKVLEIGCANGYRLSMLHNEFNSDCYGVDPSSIAIEEGKLQYPEIKLSIGTADAHPFQNESFDLIIFGFCLYVCDRQDLFQIVKVADYCLLNQGQILIYDFLPPFPMINKYSHQDGVFSYKLDYAKMFLGNPIYREIFRYEFSHNKLKSVEDPNERVMISIIRKDLHNAYVNNF